MHEPLFCVDMESFPVYVIAFGSYGGWLMVYFVAAYNAHKLRTYCLPITSNIMCLAWEAYFALTAQKKIFVAYIGEIAWFIADIGHVSAIIMYGPSHFKKIPTNIFCLTVLFVFIMNVVLVHYCSKEWNDEQGVYTAWILGVIDSILGIVLFYNRVIIAKNMAKQLETQPLIIMIGKLIGNSAAAFGCYDCLGYDSGLMMTFYIFTIFFNVAGIYLNCSFQKEMRKIHHQKLDI